MYSVDRQTAGGAERASGPEWLYNGEMTFCVSWGKKYWWAAEPATSRRLSWKPLTFSGPQPFFFMSARPYLPDPPPRLCWLTIQLKSRNSSAKSHRAPGTWRVSISCQRGRSSLSLTQSRWCMCDATNPLPSNPLLWSGFSSNWVMRLNCCGKLWFSYCVIMTL